MTDREALLRSIILEPGEDTPRLVYADWLEENGEPERAEFIRVQVELARLPEPTCGELIEVRQFDGPSDWIRGVSCGKCELCQKAAQLFRRNGELLENTPRWLKVGAERYYWARGFVSEIDWNWESCNHNADSIVWHPDQLHRNETRPCPETAQPIERVTLTTPPDPTALRKRLKRMRGGEEKEYGIDREFVRSNTGLTEMDFLTYRKRLCEACWPGVAFELPPA